MLYSYYKSLQCKKPEDIDLSSESSENIKKAVNSCIKASMFEV